MQGIKDDKKLRFNQAMKSGIQIFLKTAIFTLNATSQLRNALGIECLLSVTAVCRTRRYGWGLEFLNITSSLLQVADS
jgi:hypothetical protein